MANDQFETALENAKSEKLAEKTAVIAEQFENFPWDDPTAWNSLTTEQKLDEYSKKYIVEAAVAAAQKDLDEYRAKKNRFYNSTKKSDMDAFEATYAAAREVKNAEWQDKEDYAFATGDWELIGYTVDWAENI
jgi:hypothetical protein